MSHVQPGTAQHLLVDRFISDSDTTISRIMLNGKFECFGLEDEFRAEKVVNETRIPAGLYTIGLRTIGKHHDKYRTQFPDIHEGMLHILDVEGFEYILIHCGNTDDDTSGCLLVGTDATTQPGNMSISSSRAAYRKLYAKVIAAARAGDLTIEFVDNDR